MAANTKYEDKVNVTFEESDKNQGYKTLQLLLLHCVRKNVKDFWSLARQYNSSFPDENALFVQETEDASQICVIQTKYKNPSNRITEEELLAESGDFSIMERLQRAHGLRLTLASNSSSVSGVNFVTFVNGRIDEVEFLVNACPKVPFLDTGEISDYVFKIDVDSFFKCYSKVRGCAWQPPDTDRVYGSVYMFVNQVDINDLDKQIEVEIENLATDYNLVKIDSKTIAKHFDEFVRSFYDRRRQSKQDIVRKLCQLFISKYELTLTQDWFTFYTCPQKSIWNNIVRDKAVTIVEWDSEVATFLKQYVGNELQMYGENIIKWNTPLPDKSKHLFLKNNTDFKIMSDKYEHITMTEVYKYFWFKNKIPLLLQADTVHNYKNIFKIMQRFNCNNLQIIIISRNVLPLSLSHNITCSFLTLLDLTTDQQELVLNQKVSIQGRTDVELGKLVDKSMFQYVKCKDIIHILSQNYCIGDKFQPLPTFYADRQLFKVILKFEVVNEVNEEVFVIHNLASCISVLAERLGVYDSDRVFITQTGFTENVEKWKHSKRTQHYLLFYGNDWFEWKESSGNIRNIRRYQRFDVSNCCRHLQNALEFTNDNHMNHAHILSGCSGMGKSTLTDAIALTLPNDVWIVTIILNQHKDYFENIRIKGDLPATNHLSYFYSDILKRSICTNIELTNSVYQMFFKTKKILTLLDGFDDIFGCYKNEAVGIAKNLQKEMYPVWITTSPYEAPYLEEELCCFSNNLMRLTLQEQKDLLEKYFTELTKDEEYNANNPSRIINEFVEKLLQTVKLNFNDEIYKFTGLPLHLKLLADAVIGELKTSLKIGTVDLKHKFDLLYFYGEFTNRLSDTLCSKYSEFSKEIHQFLYGYQKIFALEVVFHSRDLYKFDIREQLEAHYKSKKDVIQMFQQESLIENDTNQGETKIVPKFEHRIHAEYLAAQWLAENLHSNNYKIKETVDILIKRRFHHPLHYKYLFRIFDHILAKDCPLHMAIMSGKTYEVEIILSSSFESAKAVDKGGRTALHIAALYGVPYSKRHDDDVIDVHDDLADIIVKFPNFKDANSADTILGYSALDYAIASKSLAIANVICSKLEDLTINVDVNPIQLETYLARCAQSENYRPLLTALLKSDICAKLLNNQLKEYSFIIAYYRNSNYNILLYNFVEEFSAKTISSLLKSLNMKSSNGSYYDIRLAAAFGTTENIFDLLSQGAKTNHMGNYSLTPLHSAILHERADNVNVLLSKGASIDVVDINGNTPLHLACQNSSIILVETLLLKGADVNRKNDDGDTPLHYALKHDCADIAELLMPEQTYQLLFSAESGERDDKKRKHFDINSQNDDGDTCLLLALKHKLTSIALKLLHNHANVNIVNKRGYSSLHFAAQAGMNDVVLELIYNWLDINKQNSCGETPMLLAVKNKHGQTTKLLLSTGANTNIADNHDGYFPLHVAAEEGEDDITLDLINGGAEIDSRSNDDSTPMLLAIINKHSSTVKLLLSNGANPHLTDEDGCKYLHHAAEADDRKIAILLLKNGVNINIQNSQSLTALMLALQHGSLRTAKVLLDKGADVLVEDKDGTSCLHYAAEAGATDIIAQMIDKGMNVDKPNKEGITPAMKAAEEGQIDVLRLLLARGANVNVVNRRGFSCLHYAVLSQNDEVVRELVNRNADINIRNNNGDTPLSLLLSLDYVYLTAAKMLLVNGENVNTTGNNGNTCFHLAVIEHRSDFVRNLLRIGADINKKNGDGDAPLIIAFGNHDWDIVKILLAAGAVDSSRGYTCLHYAINHCKKDIAVELISKGADINQRDPDGITPLALAQKRGFASLIDVLLPSEDFDVKARKNYLRLYCAAKEGNDNVLLEVLSLGLDINKPNDKGKTALLYALKGFNLSTANILVSHGADINVQDNKGFSILHYAASNGYDDMVRECIDRGFDINTRNDNGNTPLILAFQGKYISTLKLLLKSGADFKLIGEDGMSSLHYAAEMGLNDIISDFIERGADINIQNQNGAIPLLNALENYKISTARLLLENGADVHTPNEDGNCCLHFFSILLYNDEVMLEVLDRGANIEAQNSRGKTPVFIALENKNLSVAKQLLARGANITIRDADNKSCLHLAAQSGFDDLALHALNKGADINSEAAYLGCTPLASAILYTKVNVARLLLLKGADVDPSCLRCAAFRGCQEDILSLLMSKGLDINHLDKYGDTPLSVAVAYGRKSVVRYMLLNNKNGTVDKKGNSHLHYAAQMGFEDIVMDLIDRGCDVNFENDCYETPLLIAIKYSNMRVAKILLDHGADGTGNFEGNSCLHCAAEGGADDIVAELLCKGLEINKQNGEGDTPLMLAIDHQHVSTCTLLLSKGADPNIENRYGRVCLHHVAWRGAKNILLLLLKEEVDINKVTHEGESPLFVALKNDHVTVAKLFLSRDADVNKDENCYSTCLHHSARIGANELVAAIINKGCDINKVKDDYGSPFQSALEHDKHSTAQLLLSKGADVVTHGADHLYYAIKAGYDDIILELINAGVDVNKFHEHVADFPLNYALDVGKIPAAKLLIANNADITLTNNLGYSCLHYAARAGAADIVLDLIKNGLDLNKQNHQGRTPLLEALQNKKHITAKILLSSGANVRPKDEDGRSCLHFAAQAGYYDIILSILDQGVDINSDDHDGNTAFLYALKYQRLKTAEILLSNDADWTVTASNSSALVLAANAGYVDIVLELLRRGCGINKQDQEGNTAVLVALARRKIDVANLLIGMEADTNIRNYKGFSCLHYAAKLGCDHILKDILSTSIVNVNKTESEGNSPLFIALQNSNLVAARLLLSNEADVGIINNIGYSCLHCAAEAGLDDVVEELITKGCDLDRQTQNSDTPLLLALSNKHLSTAKLLISKGANPKLKNVDNHSCLHHAVKIGDEDLVLDLIRKGLDIDAQANNNNTPLHLALENDKVSIANLLLHYDANVSITGEDGVLCVHHAAVIGADKVISAIINKGVGINEKNREDHTPLLLALKAKKLETAKLLLSHGADIKVEDKEGSSCLHYAAVAGDDDLILTLLDGGFGINKQNNVDNTPLMLALQHKNIKTAKLLLSCGAAVNTGENNSGCSYLHNAAVAGDESLVLHFLNAGAHINKCNFQDETPLALAIKHKQTSTAKLLISNGAVIKQTCASNHSLLHYVAKSGCHELLKELLLNNSLNRSDVNVRNSDKLTPLHYAIIDQRYNNQLDVERQMEALKLLLDNGANIDLQDTDGRTALHCVTQERDDYDSSDGDNNELFTKDFYKGATALLLENNADTAIRNNEGLTALELAVRNNDVGIVSLIQQNVGIKKHEMFQRNSK